MKKGKKIFKIVGNTILWLFVAFAVAITVLVFAAQSDSDGVPAIGGKCFINILTPSMTGTLNAGDVIISEKLTQEEKYQLKAGDKDSETPGDIITYRVDLDGDGTEELNTHRIVRINYDENGNVLSYVTKGDNPETNPVEDPNPVEPLLVIAKYTGTRFGGLGTFLNFLQTSTGFLVCIVIPLLLFFGLELYKFIATLISVKNTGKKQITAADEEMIKQKAIEEYLARQAEAAKAKAEEAPKAEEPKAQPAEEAPAKAESEIENDMTEAEAKAMAEAEKATENSGNNSAETK